ncbi:6-phosphogluconolactonase [Fundidesulfovibrio butyratiphilus]
MNVPPRRAPEGKARGGLPPDERAPAAFTLFADPRSQARAAVDLATRALLRAEAERGAASLAVSGGTTPALFFEELAGAKLPWDRLQVFFVDERCVEPHDARSNFALLARTLLARAPLPGGNVWPMPGRLAPEEGARAYEALLRRIFAERLGQPGPGLPEFDCLHLGMGGDGHTASLFPGQAILGESARLVVASYPERADPAVARLTMTLPLLCAAREAFFLVSGPDKTALARTIAAGAGGESLPAALVRPRRAPIWLARP